jgi:hypothetical protein
VIVLKKKTKVSIIVTVVAVMAIGLISTSIVNINGDSRELKVAKNTNQSSSNEIIPLKYRSLKVNDCYDEVSTIDNAKNKVGFNPRIPKVEKLENSGPKSASKLTKVLIKKGSDKAIRGIRLEYGDIWMTVDPKLGYADYDQSIKEKPLVWAKTTVNGCPGIETEQGLDEVIGPDETSVIKYHHPTVVCWYDNGFEYTVYSENLSLAEVKDFVETMF